MKSSTHPPLDEAHRIDRLRSLAVLDTGPEALFDSLVQVAQRVCRAPIALVSLVDVDRQWFKANAGLHGISESPRNSSFCAHAIQGEDVMQVCDARRDARFAHNPLVLGAPHIRFYAGAVIRLNDGTPLGTLCVVDRRPRKLNPAQLATLRDLAIAAGHGLEFREEGLRSLELATLAHAQQERLYALTPAALFQTDLTGRIQLVSQAWLEQLGYTSRDVLGRPLADFLSADHCAWPSPETPGGKAGSDSLYSALRRKDGTSIKVRISSMVECDPQGAPIHRVGAFEELASYTSPEPQLPARV